VTDAERAAIHVLDGLAATKTAGRITWRYDTPIVDFDAISDDCCSHGESVLCAVARDLWNHSGGATIADIVTTLDDTNFCRVLEGIAISRGHTITLAS
jgi:hypothetical protein